MTSSSTDPANRWHGPEPLPSPIDVPRLGEIYSRTAAFYDGLVAEHQARAKLAALALLARRPGERFLEVGLGTAWAFARVVAQSGPAAACGVDVSEGMLMVAKQRLADALKNSLTPLLCPFALADARALPFRDGAFDCLLNTYTFEVLPTQDIAPFLDECRRVLRPGGRLVVVNLTEGEGDDAEMIEDWKRRFSADPEFFGGARPLQLQPMLEAHGFERVTRRYVGPEWPSEVLLAFRADS